MADTHFNEPRLAINRVYTKGGDSGDTGLVGGQRLPKDALRIEAYGTIEEDQLIRLEDEQELASARESQAS